MPLPHRKANGRARSPISGLVCVASQAAAGSTMSLYSRRDIAVMCYAAGLLTGLIVAFTSCATTETAEHDHITTTGEQP